MSSKDRLSAAIERPSSAPPAPSINVDNLKDDDEDDLSFFAAPPNIEDLEEDVNDGSAGGRRKSKDYATSIFPQLQSSSLLGAGRGAHSSWQMWTSNRQQQRMPLSARAVGEGIRPVVHARRESRFAFSSDPRRSDDDSEERVSVSSSYVEAGGLGISSSLAVSPRTSTPRHISAPVSPNRKKIDFENLQQQVQRTPSPEIRHLVGRPKSMTNLAEHFGSMQILNNNKSAEFYYVHPGVALLSALKTSPVNVRLDLSQAVGMALDFVTDQHGSRYVQQCLEFISTSPSSDQFRARAAIFTELAPAMLSLMTDVFGNYVIQKFFEYGAREQRVSLAGFMAGHVLDLSLQMYGCRVVQKALEFLPAAHQSFLVGEVDGHVLELVLNQNGNHVIQKCIECVPASLAPFLVASFRGHVQQMAQHPYGCRVIQRIFEHGLPEEEQTMFASLKDRRSLLDELQEASLALAQDQYGNYVIQHLLEHSNTADRTKIVSMFSTHFLSFSCHKFASNVVEKCVIYGTLSDRDRVLEEVLASSEATETMLRDQYANYVIQKMLDVLTGEQREQLLRAIQPHLGTLRRYTFGKHILAKADHLLSLSDSGGNVPHYQPPVWDEQRMPSTHLATTKRISIGGHLPVHHHHPHNLQKFTGRSRSFTNTALQSSPMAEQQDAVEGKGSMERRSADRYRGTDMGRPGRDSRSSTSRIVITQADFPPL